MNKPTLRNKPLALLIGTGLGLGAIGVQAATFQATDLTSGYAVASAEDAAAKKPAEHSCGEGGCGGDMGGDAAADKKTDTKAADATAKQKVASEQKLAAPAKK
jgi:uncharacterized low-complexity protein